MDVLVDYWLTLILSDTISINTIAEYCGKRQHVFETVDGNHAVQL